ncbi:MAG: hypothetical protein NTY12_01735 [Candidatus Falkowbacteria bacterium]|nr:hypothetical protein [Candidatus Falkowbacteria bacterium]
MDIRKPNQLTNLRVAVMPWNGITVGNAAIVNQTVAESEDFTSIVIRKMEVEIGDKEILTREIPGISEDKVNSLDEDGVVRVGQEVNYGDVIVGKVVEQTANTPDEILLRQIFGSKSKNTSEYMTLRDKGIVVDVKKIDNLILVFIAIKRRLKIGDILEDNKGNEVVVAGIVPNGELPKEKFSDNRVDMVITPSATTPLLNQASDQTTVLSVVYSLENPGFILLAPPKKTRKSKRWEYKGEEALVGNLPFVKIDNLSEDKFAAVGMVDCRFLRNRQLTDGVSISEDLLTTLIDNNCSAIANELLTVKADSIKAYPKMYASIIEDKPQGIVDVPSSLKAFEAVYNALGFTLSIVSASGSKTELAFFDNSKQDPWKRIELNYVGMDKIAERSRAEVVNHETISAQTLEPIKNGIFSENIFGPRVNHKCACGKYSGKRYEGKICNRCGVEVTVSSVRYERFGHITLAVPLIHPLFEEECEAYNELLDFRNDGMDNIFLTPKTTGRELLKKISEYGLNQTAITYAVPILPAGLRPIVRYSNGNFASSDLNDLYRSLIIRNNRIKRLQEIGAPTMILQNEIMMLQSALNALVKNFTVKSKNGERLKSLISHLYLFSKDIFNKRTAYSGRAIAVPDPSLKEDVCSMPATMASKLFEPQIIHALTSAKSDLETYEQSDDDPDIIKTVHRARKEISQQTPLAVKRTSEALTEALVVIYSASQKKVAALKVVLNKDEVIRLHPSLMERLGINLDKKNRKVSVFAPFLPASIENAKKLMKSKVSVEKKCKFSSSFYISEIDLTYIARVRKCGVSLMSNFDKLVL